MRATAAKLESVDLGAPKNRLFVTVPDYRKSHRCYANFHKNRFGKVVLRPAIAKDDRLKADLIHTTIWNEGAQVALCNSCYIDCDFKLCRADLKLKGRINEVKLRQKLLENLGIEVASFFKLTRSRSGQGIHVWFFFSGFPVNDHSKDAMQLLGKIQAALIQLLKPFGADPHAAGIERWGTNWQNPARAIDSDIVSFQSTVGREKRPILGQLYRALKANSELESIFLGPLKRWYPDQRVSRKVTAFVSANIEDLDRGKDLSFSRKALLLCLNISKTTLPELLSESVGVSKSRLRGLIIERDLMLWGHYRVSAGKDYSRLRHLAESWNAEKTGSKFHSKAADRVGQCITIFEPTRRPEAVSDGERNYCISQVYLKLKWHGCSLETAKEIVDSYVRAMPGSLSSSTAYRHEKKGANIYSRLDRNFGCRPGLAEAWLLSLAPNTRLAGTPTTCTKTPKGELLCSALPPKENKPSPYSFLSSQHVYSSAGFSSDMGLMAVGDKIVSPSTIVCLNSWRRKATTSTVVKNLAGTLNLKKGAHSNRSKEVLARKFTGNRDAVKGEKITIRFSQLLLQDQRFDSAQKASILTQFVELYLSCDHQAILKFVAKYGWEM